MEGNIRYNIDRARKAQQENEQKHDVQLEMPLQGGSDKCPRCNSRNSILLTNLLSKCLSCGNKWL